MNRQLSFASFDENFAMLQKIQPQLLQLLEDFIDITELIPVTWSLNYYKDTGRRHVNSLPAIVSALLLQKLLSIPTVELLITFLNFSEDLRNFCGLRSIPDPSFFSRFKQDYSENVLHLSQEQFPSPYPHPQRHPGMGQIRRFPPYY
jgi:hypothetical protein